MNVTVICSNNYYIKTSLSSGCVPATPKEFENGGFTLQTCQMFSVHTMPEGKNLKSYDQSSDFGLRKPRSGKSHNYRCFMDSERLRFQNDFRPHENVKLAFSNCSGLKSVYEKDGI